ncbi:MAG TPA: hypothetical protein VHZ95_17360 [Polyangiales bacterium]|nr:hypothetical protein [Polyangiales bacterium]
MAALPNMQLKRVMTIPRLASGNLVVHNPGVRHASEMARLDALGQVMFLVVPKWLASFGSHSLCARYPLTRVLAPRNSRKKVAAGEPTLEDLCASHDDPNVALGTVDGDDRSRRIDDGQVERRCLAGVRRCAVQHARTCQACSAAYFATSLARAAGRASLVCS